MRYKCVFAAVLATLIPDICSAALTLTVGNSATTVATVGTTSVVIPIFIARDSAADDINSATLAFSVGDGGPVMGGTDNSPLTAFSLDQTIFDTDPTVGNVVTGYTVTVTPGALPQQSAAIFNILPPNGTIEVTSSGLLFSITINPSALPIGIYALDANAAGLSQFTDNTSTLIPFSVTSGRTLQIVGAAVPEPGFALFALVAAGGMGYRRLRRRETETVA